MRFSCLNLRSCIAYFNQKKILFQLIETLFAIPQKKTLLPSTTNHHLWCHQTLPVIIKTQKIASHAARFTNSSKNHTGTYGRKNWVSFTSFWKKDKNYTFLFQDKKKIGSNFSSEDSHERNNNRSVHPFVIQYIIFQFFRVAKKSLIRVRNILFFSFVEKKNSGEQMCVSFFEIAWW